MKRFLCALLTVFLFFALSAGLFSCKKEKTQVIETDLNALAAETAEEALPSGEANAAIAEKLLATLRNAGFEKAEIVSSLRALKEKGTDISSALIALYEENYAKENAKGIYAALGAIADAVSPEIAGELFYSVASASETSLPYSAEDCKKLSTLVFGLNVDIDETFLTGVFDNGLSSIGQKEINTLFRSLSASFEQIKSLSGGAKGFLFELLTEEIDEISAPEEFTEEQIENFLATKTNLKNLAKVVLDDFEIALSYLSLYFKNASARLILGGPYARTEETLYYAYDYDDWKTTQITEEEYDARKGDHDDYFALEGTASGFYDGDTFVKIDDKDIELGETIYSLQLLYRAYLDLSDERKQTFRTFAEKALTALSEDESTVMLLFNLKAHEAQEDAETATFEQVLSSFSALSSFDSADGVSDHERAAATAAIEVFHAYLRVYFPHLF